MTLLGVLSLALAAVLTENPVLARLWGVEALAAPPERLSLSAVRGGLVTVVMTLTALLSWVVRVFFLVPAGAEYLQTLFFLLTVVALSGVADLALARLLPGLHGELGRLTASLTTHCAVLAVALLSAQRGYGPGTAALYGLCAGAGYTLVLLLCAVLRRRLREDGVPRSFRGAPIALVTAGLLAMAFLGFAGLQIR